ncbi:MAG: tetratricopeptide repeat protein, partial [Rhizonema sp. PD38]|nr:tetratricopeptide repeat protein [Rhizonema sp. PD38]
MDERTQFYLNTVAALLNCPSDQQAMDILAANSSVIDEGFLNIMGQVAENMTSVGRNYTANWLISLRNKLAASLAKQATHEELNLYHAFLVEVLEAIQKNPNTQVAYLLLVANQDKLNDHLADVLQAWATDVLPLMPEIAGLCTAQTIVDFSNLMKGFSLGNLEINIELAIIGYQVATALITRDGFPYQWAVIQNNLGLAYSDRIRGSLEKNRELAIYYHTQALQEHTRAHFPFDWARGQSNLGLAYSDRICGTKAHNLELAIECYQQALLENIRSHLPEIWARTQNHLGLAYSNRVSGKKAENMELAIYYYKQALLEYTLEGYPEIWAGVHNNLGNAYCDRLSGNKADNLELAIECY